jgi:glycosyltransferase involved in cell wall biosynthesis
MTDISVVIPTFRRPALLTEAMKSALSDDSVSVELVVVDDSPEGSARSVVEQLGDARVHYFKNEPPSGGKPSLVRNFGFSKTHGKLVHFLDDDDRVAPGFYRAAKEAFAHQPNRGVAFGRIEPFSDDPAALTHEAAFFAESARRARIAAKMPTRLGAVANLLFLNTLLVNSACIVRRECVEAIGGYDPEIVINEDIDFYSRAIRRFGFVFLDQVVLHYRILADSLMHGGTRNDKLREAYARMYAHYKDAYGAAELFALKLAARTVLKVL